MGLNLSDDIELISLYDRLEEYLAEKNIEDEEIRDRIVSQIVCFAENVVKEVVSFENKEYYEVDRKIDSVLTSKTLGIPIMLVLLGIVFGLLFKGQITRELLAAGLFWIEERISELFFNIGVPDWFHGITVLGIYRTLAWVVSVMLPPMAIFFPLFTLLEDLGYLPRVAFNLDSFFKKAGAHGKQALTSVWDLGVMQQVLLHVGLLIPKGKG